MSCPEPNNWFAVINLSTVNYFVAFVPSDMKEKIVKNIKDQFIIEEHSWIDSNYSRR